MHRLLPAISIFLSVAATAATRQRAMRPPQEASAWQTPHCESVNGLPSLYITRDAGDSVSPSDFGTAVESRPVIAVTDLPNVMYATFAGGLYVSRDAGCNWALRARHGHEFSNMIATSGGRAYAWNYAESHLLRVRTNGEEVIELPESMITLGADPSSPDHILAVARLGKIYESFDGGLTWRIDRNAPVWVNCAAFDPQDVRHIAVGALRKILVTHDGGFTWQVTETDANVGYLAFSSADRNVLWMYGWVPHGSQAIYHSMDDGRSFIPVLLPSPALSFNPRTLAPHPTNSAIVAFASWKGLVVLDAASGTARLGATPRIWEDVIWSPAGKALYVIWIQSSMRDP